ncbi:SAM-dependent chlorinase/fluorinase [Adhaeribacter swui]|uniref:SAM-dependent chlorinase/fluorinase n=1 Tax=Adhaeribacter swui TaxID=2086471 RepID=A0A7G7GAT1_9BACT|nr:SAM-dependent chlorinase/fluorinase [Adhaeribacter swui]QNF34265.1 SAM-dependent chlorinase/fluorinase [Adhaeribacter swui]
MGLITFLSDFGYTDHYIAAVKARILRTAPQTPIIDISHAIEPYNIAHGAFVLNSLFRDFPVGTVHLVAVDSQGSKQDRYLAVQFQDHYFVAADNGILSLIIESQPATMVELPVELPTTFAAKDVLAPAALALATGADLSDLGTGLTDYRQLINRQLRLSDHAITGHVVHVDHYGNLITNISQDSMDAIGHDRPFTVHFARESVQKISKDFTHVDEGDVVCFYNHQGWLSIGINKGHASELLGMYYDSQVNIHFKKI